MGLISLLMGSNSPKESGIRDVKGFLQNICRILWLCIESQLKLQVEERLQLCLLEEAKYLFSNTSKTKEVWGRLNDAYRLLKNGSKPARNLREMAPQQSAHSAPNSPGEKNGEGWKHKVSPTFTHSTEDLRCSPSNSHRAAQDNFRNKPSVRW